MYRYKSKHQHEVQELFLVWYFLLLVYIHGLSVVVEKLIVTMIDFVVVLVVEEVFV